MQHVATDKQSINSHELYWYLEERYRKKDFWFTILLLFTLD